jgi:hypothetical protein
MNKRMVANSKCDKSKVNVLTWKNKNEFMSAGVKHIKFWTINGTNMSSKNG